MPSACTLLTGRYEQPGSNNLPLCEGFDRTNFPLVAGMMNGNYRPQCFCEACAKSRPSFSSLAALHRPLVLLVYMRAGSRTHKNDSRNVMCDYESFIGCTAIAYRLFRHSSKEPRFLP